MDNTIGGLGSGELHWHTDQAYMAEPATGAILYGVEVPEDGPHTYWANLQLAYEALPQETKSRIVSPARYLQLRRTVQGLRRRDRAQRRNSGADA